MAQAFRTQNLRLLGNLFDKNNSLGAKGYYLHSTGDGTAWQADQNEESGILTGGILTIGTGSTISVSAGTGQIYTRSVVSSEIVTTLTNVSWSAFTNVSLTYLATKQFTYLYIDQFGALIQSDTVFDDTVFKNYIVIGIVVHLNSSTVNAVINSQNAGYGDSHRLYELYNSFGPMKRSGLSLSANGANLKINRSSGSVLLIGCNYTTDQFEPDIATLTAYTDVKFARVRANGSGGFTFDSNSGSLYTAIDPNNYDNGTGTLASVTSGYWTIQRFYLFPNVPNTSVTDRLVNYYGVATYATLSDALTALPNENFSESPFTARDAVFLGYLIVKQGVTDLSNASNAKFLQAGLSRSLSSSSASGGGSAVGSLDDLSDVQITTPLGGQFLTYDSTTSLWKNRSFILDANNNELIKFPSSVASAVNELTISNAATTGSPSISATGDDANIGLNLISKGTGLIQINGKAISLANSFTTIGNFALTFTTTGTTSLTLPTTGILATTNDIPTVNNATLTLAGSGGISLSATPTFTANASTNKEITISIADAALTIAKLADITTSRILGRTSASTGPVQELDGTGVVAVIGSSAVSRAVNLGGGIAGQIPYQSGANTTSFSAAGTANQVLLSGGSGAPTWANQSSLSVGSATTAGSVANALTISSPLTGTSYNGSSAVSIGLQNASDVQAGGVSIGAQTFAGNKTFKDNVIVSGNLTVNGSTVTINSSTLSVDDKNIELGAVIAIASLSSTVNIDAGDANVIVSSTSGLIVGQALTKISGTGAFGVNPVISSITSATQFTVSPVHATTGSIVFSVGGATDVTADGGGITLKGTIDKTIIWVDSTDAWTLSEHLNIANGKSYRINGTDVLTATTLGSSVVNSSLTSVGTLTNLTVTNTISGSVSGSAGSLSGTYTFWGQSFNGTQNVSGNLTSVGNITGTGGITITAGGSNQNITLTPSGTGYTLLNGSVGIGNSTPNNKLTIQGGDNKDTGPIINLGGNAINQFESGRIRFTEIVTGASPFYEGAYLHYDGSNNLFHIGVHNTNDALIANDVNAISIVRSSANVGIGTTNPSHSLTVSRLAQASAYQININTDGGISDGNYTGIRFSQGAAGSTELGNIRLLYFTTGSTALSFGVRNATQALYIGTDGNVGIGTITPIFKFQVVGSAYVNNGTLYIDSGNTLTWGNSTQSILGTNNVGLSFIAGSATRMFVSSGGNVGIGTITPIAKLHINSTTAGETVLRTDGTNGTLFSVVDDLSDSLMSVNNSAGLPVLEVFADDRIVAGQYGQNDLVVRNNKVGVGTVNPINKLSVIGAASIGDSTYNVSAPTNGLIVQGDVGIGITTPTSQSNYRFLQVNGANSAVIEAMVGGVRIGGFDSTSSILYVGTIGAFPIVFRTGVDEKWRITNAGVLQSSTAQTIQTATGILTLATAAGNGHIVLSPHGTGNVGIGITSPDTLLHVHGSSPFVRISNSSAANHGIKITYGSSETHGLHLLYQPGSALSFIDNTYPVSAGYVFGDIYFRQNVAGTMTTRMTIKADGGGNVGIGTINPVQKLSVVGNIYLPQGNYITWNNGDCDIGGVSGYHLVFRTYTGASMTEKFRITSDGNIGIGTTTPSSKLHISNTAAATRITITDDVANGRSGYIESNYSDALVIGTTSGVRSIRFAPDNSTAMTIAVGTNNVGIGITTPTNTIDINGTARIRSISASGSPATIFLSTGATGVLVSRTAAEVRSDIGAGTGNGTVTSVNGTGTVSGITLSGTVTTTGDLTLGGTLSVTPSNFASQTANTFLAAPNGAAGVPTFRAMVSADIPSDGVTTAKILNSNVTYAKIQNVAVSTVLGNSSASVAQAPVEINMTTLATMLSGKTMDIVGNATNVTGVVAIANGGTGAATTTANAFFVGPNGSSGAPSFRVMAAADIPASIITFAKLQDVAGPGLVGRISGTAGPVAILSSANARTAIGSTTVGSNLITLPDVTTSDKFLRVNFADNTVSALDAAAFRTAIGAGTGSGTVTSVTGTAPIASSGGATPAISLNDAGVTFAKIQNISQGTVIGRSASGTGVSSEIDGAGIASIISTNAVQNATNATNATNSTNVNITTDDATNSSYYLYFGANITGNTPLKASTKIRYNPNTGAFSATTKSFRIPHPTKPEHDLVYGSLESPYHGIRLTGKGKTNGVRAEIVLPDYVKLLIDENTVNVQITAYKCSKVFYVEDIIIQDNKIVIKYDKSWYEKAKDIEFFWDFTAERKDVPKLIVEEKL